MRRYILVLSSILLVTTSLLHAQTEAEKDRLVQQAQAGILQKLSPEQLQAKLKELGITEEQARQKAKERGVKLEDFVQGVKTDTTKGGTNIQVGQQGGGTSLEVKIPSAEDQSAVAQAAPEIVNTFRDSSPAPKGPQGLEFFGYDIFKKVPSAFEPSAVGPVDPGYLLNAGDVLRLTVWGQAEFQYELEVDKAGRVFIPNVGQVFVLGTPLNKLQLKLKNQLSKYYSGLASSPATVFMDITIAKLRPVRIFVMGEVKQPGGYTISSYATVFNALYAVGGPLTRGSLRSVRVVREKQVVASVDLYDYLLRGDDTTDVRLQNNDIIFIPPRGKTISIRGDVRRPAIYELKENEDLKTLVDLAGGLLPTAYLDHAQIDRVRPFDERKKGADDRLVVDVNLGDVLKRGGKEATLSDADELQIFSILNEKKNFVTIEGSVWRPGRYEISKMRTVKDLVAAAEGIKADTYLEKADLERIHPDQSLEHITIDLSKALEGKADYNVVLEPKDAIRVYSTHEIEFDQSVSITGHVKNPVTLPFADSLTLYDLVFKAGGLLDPEYQKNTYLERADLVRMNSDMITKRIIPFNLEKLLVDSTYNVRLEPRDEVIIYGIGVTEVTDKFVSIDGHVKHPGKFPLRSNLTLNDLILLAGGYTEDAYTLQAEVSRIQTEGLRGDSLAVILHPKLPRDLGKFSAVLRENILADPGNRGDGGFLLKHRDQISVRPNPDYKLQQTVAIDGDVKYPGVYTIQRRGERISDLLARAGGPSATTYLGGAQYFRGSERLLVDLQKALEKKDDAQDITVLGGDRLIIPSRPWTVLVSGEVNKPGLLSFIEGDDVWNYIDRSGGLTDSAAYAVLVKPTGESRRVNFGLLSADPTVPEGSSITVLKKSPEQPEEKKIDWSVTIKDSFGLVASAATIIYLISQVKK